MPSTPSPLLRLELMGNGDQPGSWGTTTNTNLGTLLEGSIAGLASVSVSSTSQALLAVNYSTDQARMAIISLSTTGAVSTAFTVYAPPVSKTYIIYNTSAYDATIRNATAANGTTPVPGGATVTIPAGGIAYVFSNGASFFSFNSLYGGSSIAIRADSSGNVGIGTNAPTGGRLHVSQSSGSAIFGSTAGGTGYGGSFENIDGGTTKFVRVAGSGGNGVFSAGVGASTQLLLDTSGNLGIGATSPGSFDSAWQRLVIGGGSGDVGQTIYSGSASIGTMAFADGTSGAQQYAGLIRYLHASDAMTFWANAAERVRIDSSGNVGIGTTNPSSKLHVSSGAIDEVARFEGTGQPYISLYDSGVREFFIQATGGGINVYGETNKPMLFYTNSVARTQIAADGAQSSVIPGGSTLYPQFACRVWINFDGTLVTNPASTTGIRGSGNVSSVLDNGAGDYTINFTTAMPDTNYSLAGLCRQPPDFQAFSAASVMLWYSGSGDITTSSCRIRIGSKANTVGGDSDLVCVQVFR